MLRYLVHDLKLSEDDKMRWYRHWVEVGLQALEAQLSARTDPTTFCFGYQPTLADIVLVPQISNAQRFVCNLQSIPNLMRIFERCMQLDAFAHTQPSACPDAESV